MFVYDKNPQVSFCWQVLSNIGCWDSTRYIGGKEIQMYMQDNRYVFTY